MDFNLRQLELFCLVVEKGSMTKAAIELDITQPAISIQLKKLQENFDFPLNEVIGKKLYVTDLGKEFYKHAKSILSQVDDLKYSLDSFNGILSGKLKISAVSTGKYIMPFYLKSFLDNNQKVELKLHISNRKEVLEELESNEIDFALVSVSPNELNFEQEVLMKNYLRLVGPKRAIVEKSLSLQKNEFPLIYREVGSGTRILMQRHFDKIDFAPKIKFELTSNEAVKQAVIAGLGYSIVPLVSIKNELKQEDLIIIKNQQMQIRSEWKIIWLKNKVLSPTAKAFIEHIRTNKKSIYDANYAWMENY